MVAGLFLVGALVQAGVSGMTAGSDVDAICAKPTIECHKEAHGILIGPPDSTAQFAGAIDHAHQAFTLYFGEPAFKAAVVLGGVLNKRELTDLRKTYPAFLSWMTAADSERRIRAALRRAMTMNEPDLTDDELDQKIDAALTQVQGSSSNQQARLKERQGVLSHELGHIYFGLTFYPESMQKLDVSAQQGGMQPMKSQRYGTPAADWLDETAAILMENPELRDRRTQNLKKVVDGENTGRISPLEDFFAMDHPVLGQLRQVTRGASPGLVLPPSGGATQMVTRGARVNQSGPVLNSPPNSPPKSPDQPFFVVAVESNEPGAKSKADFYLQAHAFAGYIIEKTGKNTVLVDIARSLKAGQSMQDWLNNTGSAMGLPTTVTAMDADFRAWLLARYSSGAD